MAALKCCNRWWFVFEWIA